MNTTTKIASILYFFQNLEIDVIAKSSPIREGPWKISISARIDCGNCGCSTVLYTIYFTVPSAPFNNPFFSHIGT